MLNEDKLQKRQYRSSSFSTVLSISLVLFMIGLLGFLVLNANKISDVVKESIGFAIILKEDVKEVDIIKLKKSLDAERFVKSTEYITKEKAAESLAKDLGEDFVGFLGYNPLLASIDLRLKADFANPDSIAWIETKIQQNAEIKEIWYQKSLINYVNENVKKISLFILGFCGILLIISVALINNTIRLAIYSKRFLIKTMQLVGATKSFIRRPFILSGIVQGIFSSLIAMLMLSVTIYFSQQQIAEITKLIDLSMLITLYAGVFLLGILIAALSTSFAVTKFLKLNNDELYK